MKTLLKLSIGIVALLPFAQVQAAPVGGKLFGDFAPGKQFTLTVSDVTVVKATISGGNVVASVPKGVPNFKEGQTVKFTIGKKGELTGPGFSTSFRAGSGVSNAYADKVKRGSLQLADVGIVFKDGTSLEPTGVNLTFYKITGSGFSTATYAVNYMLE